MLQPVRTKFRKAFKGRIHGKAARAVKLNYGQFGLKAIEPERIIGKQIEAARVALTRYMKRTGKVWTRIFPNIPVSKKPTEVRMGKGKGAPEYYACRVKPGICSWPQSFVQAICLEPHTKSKSPSLSISPSSAVIPHWSPH